MDPGVGPTFEPTNQLSIERHGPFHVDDKNNHTVDSHLIFAFCCQMAINTVAQHSLGLTLSASVIARSLVCDRLIGRNPGGYFPAISGRPFCLHNARSQNCSGIA
jgi:hypothetical protein